MKNDYPPYSGRTNYPLYSFNHISKYLLLLLLPIMPHELAAQAFTLQTDISLQGVRGGSVRWGDYNNDGYLDILLTGWDGTYRYSKIYKNNKNNSFTEQTSISLTAVSASCGEWGDYDNDGDLDILLSGWTGSTAVTKIYRNNGNNTFTEQTGISLQAVNYSSGAWGDYDNDGDLDIILTGSDGTTNYSLLYKNNGNNTFTEQDQISFYDLYGNGKTNAWADYDNDGDLDIVLTGWSGSYGDTRFYENSGGADPGFTEKYPGFVDVGNSSVDWGDYDNDGFPDLLITGHTGTADATRIYRNNGNKTFTEMTEIPLTDVSSSSAVWGDYDNDGDLDILLSGDYLDESYRYTEIWKNNGDNTFQWQDISDDFEGVNWSSSAWGDYDNDGDLDIIICGYNGTASVTKIYRNNAVTANTVPAAPAGLSSSVNGQSVTLSWNKATDSETLQKGLSYNIYLYSSSGDTIWNSAADITSGKRKIPAPGNAWQNTSWTINNLPPGDYLWSVQAIDQSFAGSPFAEEASFTNIEFTEMTGIVIEPAFNGSVEWGDYDNDGDLDILRVGTNGEKDSSMVYRNDGDNTFTYQSGIELTGVSYSSKGKWGDCDNDGDLDILLIGVMDGAWIVTELQINNGDGSFTKLIDTIIDLPYVYNGDVEWGDYDNDGDLDIIFTGSSNNSPITTIYRNDDSNIYTEQTGILLTGVYYSSVEWGDYDKDGFLDILLTGRKDSVTVVSKVFKNNEGLSFTEQTGISLQGVERGNAVWGDYDDDGDLDILLSGSDGSTYYTIIYRNEGDGIFAKQTGINLPGTWTSITEWGDYDNDGDLDILLAGWTDTEDIARIYKNNGDNTFTEQTGIQLTGVHRGTAAWGDYDNDGDLDILLAGVVPVTETTYDYISKIYRNNTLTPNTPPSAPIALSGSAGEGSLTLSWSYGSDNETPYKGLTYNVYIYSENGDTVWNSMSDKSTGYRRIPAMGNAQHNRSWTINGLEPGLYHWSVQSVDHSFAGSAFAPEQLISNEITEVADLQGTNGATAWADYDNDGDLDALVSGYYLSGSFQDTVMILYENNGDDSFSPIESLPELCYSLAEWGDYDNDGDLDLLLSGASHTGIITRIYKNNGNKTFSEQTGIMLPGIKYGDAAWGDYDNDGDLDILLSGITGTDNITRIYSNNGNNTFSEETGIILPGVDHNSVSWGDYDNDGDLDILMCGTDTVTGSFPYTYVNITKIYRNNGDGSFTEQTGISLPGIAYGSAEWGDYDNDGDPDILLVGDMKGGTTYEPISAVFRNNGNNTFTEQTGIAITDLCRGKAAWGDYNNDGYPDILINGRDQNSYYSSKIYVNNRDNSFTEVPGLSLVKAGGTVNWGDYDNDGDLDILLNGVYYKPPPASGSAYYTKIYKNNTAVLNSAPDAPGGLSSSVSGYSVTLSWDKATDDHTPQNGLSYNAYLYMQGGDTTWSSMADISSGYRRLPATGNARQNTGWTIDSLELGTYSWSVQAIDHSFKGSAFAAEGSFEINPAPAPETHDTSSCLGDPVPGLIASGQNIKWYSDAGLQTLVYSGSTFVTGKVLAGSYIYYVTQTIDGFESQATTATLTIHVLPAMTVTDSTNITCSGLSDGTVIVSSAAGTAPFTYQWDDGANTTGAMVSGLQPGIYYHVTITDANQCTSVDSVMLSEPAPLTAVITDSTHVSGVGMSDGTATVEASGGTSPYSYLWDDDASTAAATVTGLSAFTWYHYTVKDDHSCTYTDSIILPVVGEFNAIITDHSDVSCYGYSDGTATVSAFGLNTPFTYLWDDDAGTTTAAVTGLSPNRWYRVSVTDASSNVAVDSILLAQPDQLVVHLGADQDICEGESVTLDAGASYQTYTWTPGGATTRQLTVSESNSYSVLVTNAKGCQAADTATVTVHAMPAAQVAANREICEGESVPIGADDTGNTFSWVSNPTGFTSSQANPEVTPSVTTTYILTESIASSGCQSTNSVTITVNPRPVINILDNQTICEGEPNEFHLGGTATAGNSYAWTSRPAGYNSAEANPAVSPGASTTYVLVQTIVASGCQSADSVKIIINPSPSATILDNQVICESGITTFNLGATAVPGNSCTWKSNPSGFGSTESNPQVTPASTITYILKETVDVSGCLRSDSVTITIHPDPVTSILNDTNICGNDPNEFQIGGPETAGHSYLWTSDPSGLNSSQSNPSVTVIQSTIYILTQTIIATGCFSMDTVEIKVGEVPDAMVANDAALCASDIGEISLGGEAVSGHTYSWTSLPAGYTSSDANPVLVPEDTRTYILTETDDASGCSASDSVTVSINSNPDVTLDIQDNPIHRDDSTLLTASGAATYVWTPESGLDTTAGASVVAKPLVTTTYTVTGTDNNGCTNTKTKILDVNCYECGETMMFESTGRISHGCTENNYNNDANCSWTLFPSGVSSLYLCFNLDSFDIYRGDKLDVFDGQDATGTLVGSYNNANLPPFQLELGNVVYIRFISNSTTTAKGFNFYYSDKACAVGAEIPLAPELRLYPNPTSGAVTLEWNGVAGQKIRLSLYNSMGKLMMDKEFDNLHGPFSTELELQEFANGVYFLQFITEEGVISRKLVKE